VCVKPKLTTTGERTVYKSVDCGGQVKHAENGLTKELPFDKGKKVGLIVGGVSKKEKEDGKVRTI